jgi:hypothetical protein
MTAKKQIFEGPEIKIPVLYGRFEILLLFRTISFRNNISLTYNIFHNQNYLFLNQILISSDKLFY